MEFHDYPIIILFIICVLIVIAYYIVKCCKMRLNEFSFVQFFGKKNMPPTQPHLITDPESDLPNPSGEDWPNAVDSADANDEFGSSVRSRATVGFENIGYLDDSNEFNGESPVRKRIDSKESNSTTESIKESRLSQIRESLLESGVRQTPRSSTLQCPSDPENNFAGPHPTASSSLDNEHLFAGQIINISMPRFDSYSNGLNRHFLRPGMNGIRPTLNGPSLNILGLRLSGLGLGQQQILNNSRNESSNNVPLFGSTPELINEIHIEGENVNEVGESGNVESGNVESGNVESGNDEAGNGEASNGEAGNNDGSSFTDSNNAYTTSSSSLSTYGLDADSLSTDSVFY